MFLESHREIKLYNNMELLSDQKALEVSEIIYNNFKSIREEERLDPNQLHQFKEKYVKTLYSNKIDQATGHVRKYYCCEACCGESPGRFCCGKSTQPDPAFIKLGLGICLYFKYLKHTTLFYFFMSLLALLSCAVCFVVAIENDFNPLENYNTFFFSTTYGVFSAQKTKCNYATINTGLLYKEAKMKLSCPHGEIDFFGSTFTEESLNSLYNCRNQQKKITNSNSQYSTTAYQLQTTKTCNSDMTSCEISVKFALATNTPYKRVAYSYQCMNNEYSVGKVKASSGYSLLFIVAIDLFFCLCYFIFLCSEVRAESNEESFFKKTKVSLNDFSVEIQGFKRSTFQKQLKDMFEEFHNVLGAQFNPSSIVSITFPQGEQMLDLYYQQRKIYFQLYDLMNEFYFREEEHLVEFTDCHNILKSRISEQEYEQYKVKLTELINSYINLQRREVYREYKNNDEEISLYMVTTGIRHKRRFMKLMKERCCGDRFTVQQRNYFIKDAPIPDMINWENRSSWTFCRKLISWLLTLIICVGSYILFGFIQLQQNYLFSDYNYGIDCNVLYTNAELASFNIALSAQSPQYLTCICKNKGMQLLTASDNDYCSNWSKQYILYLTIPLLISLGIVFYNIIVSFLFKLFSKFQRNQFIIYEEMSYTLKRAFLLIMNMGLIMILLNLNYNNSINIKEISFIFLGRYDDFTSDWYSNIGAIIILTMIFNIAFPIIELLLALTLKFIKRCWDRRCFRVPTSRETKKEYIGLYSDDIFSISERYAYLVATLIVSLAFCGIIPFLTPIAFISFFLLYYSDKILMFKFFQTPINYDHALHQLIAKTIMVGLIAHCALTAYFLSEPSMIATGVDIIYGSDRVHSGNNRIDNILNTNYIVPYIAFLVLLLLFVIFKSVVFGLFSKIAECFKKMEFEGKSMMLQEISFWDVLTNKQIDMLFQLTMLNIAKQTQRMNEFLLMNTLTISANQSIEDVTLQQDILNNTLRALDKRKQMLNGQQFEGRTRLLGLPSYQYLCKNDELQENKQILDMQMKIKSSFNYSSMVSRHLSPKMIPEVKPAEPEIKKNDSMTRMVEQI